MGKNKVKNMTDISLEQIEKMRIGSLLDTITQLINFYQTMEHYNVNSLRDELKAEIEKKSAELKELERLQK